MRKQAADNSVFKYCLFTFVFDSTSIGNRTQQTAFVEVFYSYLFSPIESVNSPGQQQCDYLTCIDKNFFDYKQITVCLYINSFHLIRFFFLFVLPFVFLLTFCSLQSRQ